MRNASLERAMAGEKLSQPELAGLVNAEIRRLTGHYGAVSDRTVRQWLSGAVRWPQERQRLALEAVFGRSCVELGFVPRGREARTHEKDDPMHRRTLFAATAAAAASIRAPRRIGSSDVDRLNAKFAAIVASDHRDGGRTAIEAHALALADEALALQGAGGAGQRVRAALYASAAAFTSSAMWAAIDGRRFDAAQRHLGRASSLAAMSGDQAIQFRIWSHAGTLYRHLRRPADALAANDVARRLAITRRDPLFASLGHARHAAILGLAGDKQGVRRSMAQARAAFDRADRNLPRPRWMAEVQSGAEIEELALSACLSLGEYAQAEAHAHQSLDLLPVGRDRALSTVRLAQSLLGQGETEYALTTITAMPYAAAAQHPRVLRLLHDVDQDFRSAQLETTHRQTWNAYLRGELPHAG
jgi:tetratricopeptide (TPR) repeat protein